MHIHVYWRDAVRRGNERASLKSEVQQFKAIFGKWLEIAKYGFSSDPHYWIGLNWMI